MQGGENNLRNIFRLLNVCLRRERKVFEMYQKESKSQKDKKEKEERAALRKEVLKILYSTCALIGNSSWRI